MFNGIVMSNVGDTSIEVDVVDDDTTTYGPAQYPLCLYVYHYRTVYLCGMW